VRKSDPSSSDGGDTCGSGGGGDDNIFTQHSKLSVYSVTGLLYKWDSLD
jgi:hypothetical protein